MKKSEVFSGKSIDEAKAKAAESFGVPEEKIRFTVIEDVKKGFFGRIKSEARVQADYEEAEKAAVPEMSKGVVLPVIPVRPVKSSKPKTENTFKSSSVNETAILREDGTLDSENIADKNNAEAEISEETENTVKEVSAEKIEASRKYVEKVLENMGLECELDVKTEDGSILIEIDSKGSGAVIGRRGETLDSLQYLCSLVVNRTEGDYTRITLDSNGYREKRAETLKQLAVKICNKVLKTGKSTVLEPMNPYERRIIHSAVAKIEGVNSKSVGEEPYRKVIIASNNPKKRDKSSHKGGRGKGGSKPHREPRSLDLKTSFEKDYKKPKPEDDINAGLYGKIEF